MIKYVSIHGNFLLKLKIFELQGLCMDPTRGTVPRPPLQACATMLTMVLRSPKF